MTNPIQTSVLVPNPDLGPQLNRNQINDMTDTMEEVKEVGLTNNPHPLLRNMLKVALGVCLVALGIIALASTPLTGVGIVAGVGLLLGGAVLIRDSGEGIIQSLKEKEKHPAKVEIQRDVIGDRISRMYAGQFVPPSQRFQQPVVQHGNPYGYGYTQQNQTAPVVPAANSGFLSYFGG